MVCDRRGLLCVAALVVIAMASMPLLTDLGKKVPGKNGHGKKVHGKLVHGKMVH